MLDAYVPRWVWASLALTALASLLTIVPRHLAEQKNHSVGLVLEADNIRQAGLAEGKTYAESLQYLASRGLTAVVLGDVTVGDAAATGGYQVVRSQGQSAIQAYDDASWSMALDAARARFGPNVHPGEQGARPFTVVVPGADTASLKSFSLGIDPDDARTVRDAGLEIIARHANLPGVDKEYVDYLLESSHERGAVGYLPVGDAVLGYRDLIPYLGDKLRALDMQYVAPEFAKMAGDSKMMEKFPGLVVRLHAAQQAETDRMAPEAIVERYAKAFKERNIRWLLLRPTTLSATKPLREMAVMLVNIRKAIIKERGVIGPPEPFAEPEANPVDFALIGLFAAPFVAWTVSRLTCPKYFGWILLGAAALGAAGYLGAARPYVALASATTAPLLGFLWLSKTEAPPWRSYLVVSLVTLVGGLVVAGSLVGVKYMIQAEQFTGIKMAVFLPILVVGALFANEASGLKNLSKEPVKWGTLVAGLVFLAAMAFMISRTGNDNPAGVSTLELKFRAMLDFVFSTRPRTKEFLVGHPAFVLGLFLWAGRAKWPKLRGWAALLLTVGAVGQTSVVNTFCHAHSPVVLSLQRVVTGHITGCILGLCLWGVASKLLKSGGATAGVHA